MSIGFKLDSARVVNGRVKPGLKCGEGRTKQAFLDQVDVNKIMARYNKTGMFTHVNGRQPFYGDVSSVVGYREALDRVMEAESLFKGMSAEVRNRFGNDPARMIDFLEDPKNLDEALKLGMVVKRPEPPISKVMLTDASGKPVEPFTPPPGGSTPKE